MDCCYFGIFSYKSLDIILTFIFLTIRNQTRNRYNQKNKDKNFILKNIYLNCIIVYLGQFLSIFLFLIQKKLSTSEKYNKNEEKKKNEAELVSKYKLLKIFNPKAKEIKFLPSKKKMQYFILIFISSIFGILSSLFLYSRSISIGEIPIFFILTTLILSNKFLNETYHRHHYFSLLIILISSIFHIIYEIKNENLKEYSYRILIIFIASVLNGIQGIIQKHLMKFHYISPFVILTHQGFISTILLIILCSIFSYIKCNSFLMEIKFCFKENEQIFDFQQITSFEKSDILSIIIYSLSSMLYYIMKTLVIYFWTPCHFGVSISLTEIGNIIYKYEKKHLYYYIIQIVIRVVYFFATLIFCELLILNFCGLNFNTYNEVHNRANIEIQEITENIEISIDSD